MMMAIGLPIIMDVVYLGPLGRVTSLFEAHVTLTRLNRPRHGFAVPP